MAPDQQQSTTGTALPRRMVAAPRTKVRCGSRAARRRARSSAAAATSTGIARNTGITGAAPGHGRVDRPAAEVRARPAGRSRINSTAAVASSSAEPRSDSRSGSRSSGSVSIPVPIPVPAFRAPSTPTPGLGGAVEGRERRSDPADTRHTLSRPPDKSRDRGRGRHSGCHNGGRSSRPGAVTGRRRTAALSSRSCQPDLPVSPTDGCGSCRKHRSTVSRRGPRRWSARPVDVPSRPRAG